MGLSLAVVVIAMSVGLILCLPVGLTLWAVLGGSHFLLRLTALLACIASVGAFFANDGRQIGESLGILIFVVFLAGVVWLFRNPYARLFMMALIIGWAWLIVHNLGSRFIDPRSFSAASIAIPLAASLVLTFRVLGFRFIRLTGTASDLEIERGTGSNIDTWLSQLQRANGEQMTRAEIAAFLREQGVPFSWQRVLVDAYEMSLGRKIIRVSADGIPETIISHSHLGKAVIERRDVTRFRWSLRQLLTISVIAAGLFALARVMALEFPTARQLGLLMTGALSAAVISVPVLAAELSVERHWINRAVYLGVAVLIAWQIPLMLGIRSPLPLLAGAVLSILFFTTWLVCAVTLVRHNGYRVILAGRPTAQSRKRCDVAAKVSVR